MEGVPIRSRFVAAAIAALLPIGAAAMLAGCSGPSPISHEATTTVPAGATPTSIDTSFYPEGNVNLSDCLGSLERPGCGSKARGGWRMGLTFAILAVALVFIGWRLVRAWKRRDRQMAVATSGDGNWVKSNLPPKRDQDDDT